MWLKNFLWKIKLLYTYFLDELYIRKDEFHYTLDSRYVLYSEIENFQLISKKFLSLAKESLWFKNKERLMQNKSEIPSSLHERYLNRLLVRREISRLEKTSFFQKNILWYKVRIFGCGEYFLYLRKQHKVIGSLLPEE
jgi:hypothetical protein